MRDKNLVAGLRSILRFLYRRGELAIAGPLGNKAMAERANKTRIGAGLNKFGVTPSGIALLAIIGVLPLILTDEFSIRLLVTTLMFGTLAMAFDFTTGFINICNFGFSAFWGVGAYGSALLATRLGVSPWICMILGGLMAGLCGFGLGLLTIRLGGIFASCMTWFVALAMLAVADNWVALTNGSTGLTAPPLLQTVKNMPYYYIMFSIMIGVFLVLMYFKNSNFGLAFRAIGQDGEAAASCGVNPTKYKIINFSISCALAGVIGAFYAHYIGILSPHDMATSKTVEIMAISFIGGRGTIWGGLACALIMVPVMDLAKDLLEVRLLIYGALMILVMIMYPKGLVGIVEIILKAFKAHKEALKRRFVRQL